MLILLINYRVRRVSPPFDPQLGLSLAEESQICDFARSYFTRDLRAAPRLIDDEPEAVLRDSAVGVEKIS
jgi:hypothetical protein